MHKLSESVPKKPKERPSTDKFKSYKDNYQKHCTVIQFQSESELSLLIQLILNLFFRFGADFADTFLVLFPFLFAGGAVLFTDLATVKKLSIVFTTSLSLSLFITGSSVDSTCSLLKFNLVNNKCLILPGSGLDHLNFSLDSFTCGRRYAWIAS